MMWNLFNLLVIALVFNYCEVKCDDTEKRGCGWQNSGEGFQIADDGKTANFAEFPWMAALLNVMGEKDMPLNVYFGGGSLIHPRVVLTAAHLVTSKKGTIKVRAGEWDTTTKKEIHPHQDRDVESIIVHEDYEKANLTNNIALLILAKPFELAPNVGLACLPKPQQGPQAGTKCLFSGWGKDSLKGHYSTILKKVEMPIIAPEDCQEKLRRSRLGSWFELRKTFLCAGEKGKYTCRGDGGSPLACPLTKDRYVQNGIAMWGINCDGEMPSVFVDVASLREWVDKKMQEKGLETTTYSDY